MYLYTYTNFGCLVCDKGVLCPFMQVVYNSLMNAYSNSRMPDEARKIFEDIQAEGLQPDMVCVIHPIRQFPRKSYLILLSFVDFVL